MAEQITSVFDKLMRTHFENSMIYRTKQKAFVRDLKLDDMEIRILSFMLDSIFMFWPSLVFVIALLLLTSPANIGGGIIHNTWELTIMYVVSILLFNTISAVFWRGQTFGMRYFKLKIVAKDNSEISLYKIMARELIGVSIPWALIILSYDFCGFTNFFTAFLLFVVLNLMFIAIDKKHRSFIDILFRTKMVILPEIKIVTKKPVVVKAMEPEKPVAVPVKTEEQPQVVTEPVKAVEKLKKAVSKKKEEPKKVENKPKKKEESKKVESKPKKDEESKKVESKPKTEKKPASEKPNGNKKNQKKKVKNTTKTATKNPAVKIKDIKSVTIKKKVIKK